MKDDPLVKAAVTYPVVGNTKYDEFFKKSAEMRGRLIASQAVATTTLENMKETARSEAAKGALGDSIKEVVGEQPESMWSVEETAAIIKLQRKRGEVATDRLKGFSQSVASIRELSTFHVKLPMSSTDLANQGRGLAGSVPHDFIGPAAIKAPQVTGALNDSAGWLKEAGEQAPLTAKELVRLGDAITMALEWSRLRSESDELCVTPTRSAASPEAIRRKSIMPQSYPARSRTAFVARTAG